MNQDDFIEETTSMSVWGESTSTQLRTDRLKELRAG